jgi:hypothetical protein
MLAGNAPFHLTNPWSFFCDFEAADPLGRQPFSFGGFSMTQNQLYREVAHVTGESVGFIKSHGFSMVIVPTFFPIQCSDVQVSVEQPKPVNQNKQLLRKSA